MNQTQGAEMETQELIDTSYTIYGEMEQIYVRLNAAQLAETENALSLMQQLEELRSKVQGIDSRIMTFLQQKLPDSEELRRKLSARNSRIHNLLKLNKEITEKAACHRAMVKAERNSIQHGQTALSGYRATVGDYRAR